MYYSALTSDSLYLGIWGRWDIVYGRDDSSSTHPPCALPLAAEGGAGGETQGVRTPGWGHWVLIDTIHVAVLNVFISSDIVA